MVGRGWEGGSEVAWCLSVWLCASLESFLVGVSGDCNIPLGEVPLGVAELPGAPEAMVAVILNNTQWTQFGVVVAACTILL